MMLSMLYIIYANSLILFSTVVVVVSVCKQYVGCTHIFHVPSYASASVSCDTNVNILCFWMGNKMCTLLKITSPTKQKNKIYKEATQK